MFVWLKVNQSLIVNNMHDSKLIRIKYKIHLLLSDIFASIQLYLGLSGPLLERTHPFIERTCTLPLHSFPIQDLLAVTMHTDV